ncbi:putative zinc-binding protein [Anaeroselena agilis]|uniref:Zinc-binding protein n=1 Tax=Anaeroselena agilis TaxID=3063788 RepID=A0ABU3NU42_9FIRM|nr:putative zinc-binding protein [Selenomonadales bacterium 4137-cl]
MAEELKIGVVSCSGEDCLGGTISRLATRKMLDEVRPDKTVTICLPLFLAGGQEERMFAKTFPTIAVDGCNKACAKRATEKYSGKVNGTILVSDIIGDTVSESAALSTRDVTAEHQTMVDKVAAEITKQFDAILNANSKNQAGSTATSCGCSCSGGCG